MKRPPVRFAPFAFPLRTAVATSGVPSAGNARQRPGVRSMHRTPGLWTTLWTRMWTMRKDRGQRWETAQWTVEEVGKPACRSTPYPGMTSGNAVHRSSTGCGQKIPGAREEMR